MPVPSRLADSVLMEALPSKYVPSASPMPAIRNFTGAFAITVVSTITASGLVG